MYRSFWGFIRPVNTLSHYTDWTVGHVHAGALGWVAFISFGAMYKMVPGIWKREGTSSLRLEAWHFWLALSGTLIYVGAMWNSGITQDLMWQTYDADGNFVYAFIDTVDAMRRAAIANSCLGPWVRLGLIVLKNSVLIRISETLRRTGQPDFGGEGFGQISLPPLMCYLPASHARFHLTSWYYGPLRENLDIRISEFFNTIWVARLLAWHEKEGMLSFMP